MKALACLGAACLSLVGCSLLPTHGEWPIPPEALRAPFILQEGNPNAVMVTLRADLAARGKAAGEASVKAMQSDWGSGDVTTLGGITAVIGGLAEKIGLVNSGAAIGLVGGAGRARYQYASQATAYQKAEDGYRCISSAIALLTDEQIAVLAASGNAEVAELATSLPHRVVEAANGVRKKMFMELANIGAEQPTREQIIALAEQFKATPPTGGDTVSNSQVQPLQNMKINAISGTQSAELKKFIATAKSVQAEIAKCSI